MVWEEFSGPLDHSVVNISCNSGHRIGRMCPPRRGARPVQAGSPKGLAFEGRRPHIQIPSS
jgi:hypothetical protein